MEHVWWVNEGKTYQVEASGGFLWAPLTTRSGSAAGHHTSVSRLRPGHVVLHYANGAICAFGLVSSWPIVRDKPESLPDDWGREGHYVEVEYFPLDAPIALVGSHGSAVDRWSVHDGRVGKQGYLFPLDTEFSLRLRADFRDRWPSESPWRPYDRSAPAHWLFQAVPEYWDLADNLTRTWSVGEEDTWKVTAHRDRMQPGDQVALWTAGQQAAVLALAELTGRPFEDASAEWEQSDARRWHVPLRLTRVLDEPITRDELRADPVLQDLTVLRAPQGTNFVVSRRAMGGIDDARG